MKNTKDMQNQKNIILTVQLNKDEFDCLQYYIGCKDESYIFVTKNECLEDLSFCLSKEDKKNILQTNPDIIEFAKM